MTAPRAQRLGGPLPVVRIVVPRLADDGERDKIWEFCRRYWAEQLPDIELVESDHKGDGPFNRSAAINVGAQGEWDALVILDADVILDPEPVREAVRFAAEEGLMVLPFERRRMLNASGTQRILQGHRGSWSRWIASTEYGRVSCCIVVPRALWEVVRGFDERFEGWGGEDEAFYFACRESAGVARLNGDLWHLHHAPSKFQTRCCPTYRQALALSLRYGRSHGEAMRRLLAEERSPDATALVVLTTGRDTLAATLASAEESLSGLIGRRLIVVDGSAATAERIAGQHHAWDVERVDGGNYPAAMSAAIDRALGCGQPWIFWLEDDFTFNAPVDISELQAMMQGEPRLAQLALLRQPWFQHEVAAGGVFAAKPGAYTQRKGFVEHQDHWTQNPMLTRRALLASFEWPKGPSSEKRFGDAIYASGLVSGYLGALKDPPRVTHIGIERAGSRY